MKSLRLLAYTQFSVLLDPTSAHSIPYMKLVTSCVLAALLLVACGKKSPTAPVITTTGISISSNGDVTKIGAQQQLTLTASMSDGTTKTVTGTWTSDAAAVATVTGGLLRGVANGEATIAAEYDGQRTTRRVRVIPDFMGAWSGSYRITTCTDSGVLAGTCDPADVPKTFSIKVNLTHNTSAVSGTVAPFVDLTIPAQGSIELDGLLKLSGSKIEDFGDGFIARGELIGWESRLPDATHMTGKFTVVTTIPGLVGDWTMNCDLVLMTKTSSTPARFDGPSIDDAARRLGDLLRRPR